MKKFYVDEEIQQVSYDYILLSTILDIKEAKKRGDWNTAMRLIDELENLLTPYGVDKVLEKEMNGKEFQSNAEKYNLKERILLKHAKSCGFLPASKVRGTAGGNL